MRWRLIGGPLRGHYLDIRSNDSVTLYDRRPGHVLDHGTIEEIQKRWPDLKRSGLRREDVREGEG